MWRRAGALAAATLLAFGLVACGDDDTDDTTTGDATTDDSGDATTGDTDGTGGDTGGTEEGQAAAGDAAAFCDPFFEFRGALFETPEDETATAYVEDEILPLVEQIEQEGEGDVADAAATFASETRTHMDDPEALFGEFEDGALGEAFNEMNMAAADDCGWERIDVDAVDFGYEGVPDELDAGRYAVVMTNATEAGELHEIGFVKLNDDSDLTLDELLDLPDEELESEAEFVDAAFAPPGDSSASFIELEPGTYYYACFIPVGSGGEGEPGPPHHAEGMKGELTVS